MTIGSNILKRALKIIGQSSFTYYPYASRATNAIGLDVTTYGTAVTLKGSIQPVASSMYEQMGLDFQKKYVTVYVSKNILDVARDISGDKIVFNGKSFQCESATDWFAIDGWDAILCVEI